MIKITLRKFVLFSVFSLGATAHALMLNLVTEPEFKTIGASPGERFVAVKKGDMVKFTVSPEKTIDTLTWTFDGGRIDKGGGSGTGPQFVYYEGAAENQINKVWFYAEREDTDTHETCTTKKKVTCQVLVPKITFDYLRGGSSGRINWSDPAGHPWGNGHFYPPPSKNPFFARLWINISGIGRAPRIWEPAYWRLTASGPCNSLDPREVVPQVGLDNSAGLVFAKVEIPGEKKLKIKTRIAGDIQGEFSFNETEPIVLVNLRKKDDGGVGTEDGPYNTRFGPKIVPIEMKSGKIFLQPSMGIRNFSSIGNLRVNMGISIMDLEVIE